MTINEFDKKTLENIKALEKFGPAPGRDEVLIIEKSKVKFDWFSPENIRWTPANEEQAKGRFNRHIEMIQINGVWVKKEN